MHLLLALFDAVGGGLSVEFTFGLVPASKGRNFKLKVVRQSRWWKHIALQQWPKKGRLRTKLRALLEYQCPWH